MKIIDEDLIMTEAVPFLSKNGVNVHVLRLDKINPIVSGNKWFKLRFHLEKNACKGCYKSVVTFGGAYSNHIVATAAACENFGIKSIGLIRGEEPKIHSHTLQAAASFGMQFIFLSREDYKEKHVPATFKSEDYYIIPEGGYSLLGAAGAATIPYHKDKYDLVACAVGTGTMMAGLINSKKTASQILGFSTLKNHTNLESEVLNLLLDKNEKMHINHNYHFGGYAKYTAELIQFMNDLFDQTGIPTDFVYTAKLFYGIQELITTGQIKTGSELLLIHSGGYKAIFPYEKER
ncbi:1-aminocyclopropane-1-carboxylate deaminase/D-cysteine desulfhydrase [Niabella ginsengisoli]|uniref:Pyridoxal-phosphate dependent enzyme n=1 Tax=Niabella ginsengisoli TaxID=522298 RepID=A0ABS9SJN7_9BACT|nr:pyridoxal-phosphate dependent enzyme [Niabella ginsengisoli]MCH5598574.1 pyridoxal-phosphate dependent enzyme [Niabella ginsengisoli]